MLIKDQIVEVIVDGTSVITHWKGLFTGCPDTRYQTAIHIDIAGEEVL